MKSLAEHQNGQTASEILEAAEKNGFPHRETLTRDFAINPMSREEELAHKYQMCLCRNDSEFIGE